MRMSPFQKCVDHLSRSLKNSMDQQEYWDEHLTVRFNGVSLVGTARSVTLGKADSTICRWARNHGEKAILTSAVIPQWQLLMLLQAMGRRILSPAFSKFSRGQCTFCSNPCSPMALPFSGVIANEGCYGHANHDIKKGQLYCTPPLQAYNNTFIFWAHLQVWTRLLKETWMPH